MYSDGLSPRKQGTDASSMTQGSSSGLASSIENINQINRMGGSDVFSFSPMTFKTLNLQEGVSHQPSEFSIEHEK